MVQSLDMGPGGYSRIIKLSFIMENQRNLTELFAEALRYEQGRSPLTVEAYLRDLRQFISFVTGDKDNTFDPLTISTSDVRAWLAELSRGGIQTVSVKRKLQSVRAFFHFMMRSHRMDSDPTGPIELSVRRKRLPKYVPEREMERLLAADDASSDDFEQTRDRMIMLLLYTTGMRRAEALRLHDDDLRLERGEVLVHGKGNKERLLPLGQEVVTLIRQYLAMRDELTQQPDHDGQQPFLTGKSGCGMSERTLSSIVKRELAGTSAEQRSPHVLRHTFATAMLNGGADINTVKTFLGHASLATTQIYTHVTFADMKRAYNTAHPRAGGAINDKEE